MALDKKHKAFRFAKAMPIDANNVSFEQAFARLLVLVRTKGLPITTTTKSTLHPEDLVEIITQDKEHFQGIKDDPQRKRLLEHWLASDFTTCVKEGRGHTGEARIASMKPIHMSTIKRQSIDCHLKYLLAVRGEGGSWLRILPTLALAPRLARLLYRMYKKPQFLISMIYR